MFFDPFAPIGPLMKLAATLPLMIIYYLGLRVRDPNPHGDDLRSLKRYIPLSVLGTIIRIGVMIIANILLFTYMINLSYAKISIGQFTLSSWTAVIFVTVLINAETSIWDCALPYLTVFSTKVYDHFRFW
jgi:amino acid transporter